MELDLLLPAMGIFIVGFMLGITYTKWTFRRKYGNPELLTKIQKSK